MKEIQFLEAQVTFAKKNNLTTDAVVEIFQEKLAVLKTSEFIDLLVVSGYIPDAYPEDGSEETLYSKLTEQIVCEWAKRIGFKNSVLQKRKSSVEDITIHDGTSVIVADAKSFRLGRSQQSPNPKDVLKQGDYPKWLSKHSDSVGLGGILTFPSLFEWKVSSDIHSYLTDSRNIILLLYYEHLASILHHKVSRKRITQYFSLHPELFPEIISKTDNPKAVYFSRMEQFIFNKCYEEHLNFKKRLIPKLKSLIEYAIARLDHKTDATARSLRSDMKQFSDKDLQIEYLLSELIGDRTHRLRRMKDNIVKFRRDRLD